MWCPTTVFGPKLASRAAERSLVILGKAVSGNSVEGGNGVSNGVPALKTWWEQATSAFLRKCYPFRAFHQVRSMKCLFQEGCDSLMLETPCTHMSLPKRTLPWCGASAALVLSTEWPSEHTMITRVKLFCHGCNLCGENFAACKDLKCHFAAQCRSWRMTQSGRHLSLAETARRNLAY